MKSLIVHYHLNPGGVTNVIKSQLQVLTTRIGQSNRTILLGDRPLTSNGFENSKITVSEYFDYLQDDLSVFELKKRYEKMIAVLLSAIDQDTLVHTHNSSLGKNPLLTYIIYILASRGVKILNQCHDFAEDRPMNLNFLRKIIGCFSKNSVEKILYPPFPNCHFAVLNSKDYRRLKNFGIQNHRIHLLPNPISFTPSDQGKLTSSNRAKCRLELGIKANKMVMTYPIRVIRRKNIGEFILLATLFANKADWLITLPPKNPIEKEEYLKWKEFCRDRKIRVFFDIGERLHFYDILGITDRCVTTSIREGFGMVFIEPWLFSIPVVGRNLPYVTDDFVKSGIKYPYLYDKIEVQKNSRYIDFCSLSLADRMELIGLLHNNNQMKQSFLKQNRCLKKLFTPITKEVLLHNKHLVEENYSIEKYGDKLHGIYKALY